MRRRTAVLSTSLLALVAWVVTLAATAAPAQQRPLRQFMRQKLEHSQGLLEGMALEDYALILKSAEELKRLAEDARWRVSPNINYLRLSNEFQGLADEIAAKSRERNLDGVTLSFFKLTNNCVACHRLVRDERLITLRGD